MKKIVNIIEKSSHLKNRILNIVKKDRHNIKDKHNNHGHQDEHELDEENDSSNWSYN